MKSNMKSRVHKESLDSVELTQWDAADCLGAAIEDGDTWFHSQS